MRALIATALALTAGTVFAEWEYLELVDDFDDTTQHILQTRSLVPISSSSEDEYQPALQLRCEAGGQPMWRLFLNAIVDQDFSVNTVSNQVVGNISMRVRIDDEEVTGPLWDWVVDDTLQGLYTYRVPAIVSRLEGAAELKLRIGGWLGESHDLTFDVSGFDESLKQLEGVCRRI